MKKVKKAFSAKDIARRVAALGAEIRNDAGDGEAFLLGILNGGAVLTADLLRSVEGEVGYGFIDVVRDMSDTEVATALEIDFLSHIDIRNRNIYVIKDVVSTGVIETYLLTQLRQKGPAILKLIALLDRPNLRTVELKTDFSAFEVAEGSFVGYGLEFEGRFGNLPYLGRIA